MGWAFLAIYGCWGHCLMGAISYLPRHWDSPSRLEGNKRRLDHASATRLSMRGLGAGGAMGSGGFTWEREQAGAGWQI
jgi:hypothetical protein